MAVHQRRLYLLLIFLFTLLSFHLDQVSFTNNYISFIDNRYISVKRDRFSNNLETSVEKKGSKSQSLLTTWTQHKSVEGEIEGDKINQKPPAVPTHKDENALTVKSSISGNRKASRPNIASTFPSRWIHNSHLESIKLKGENEISDWWILHSTVNLWSARQTELWKRFLVWPWNWHWG